MQLIVEVIHIRGYPGGIDGFQNYYEGLVRIDKGECLTLWSDGVFKLDMGSQIVTFNDIPSDSSYTTSQYVLGSGLETDHACDVSSLQHAYLPDGKSFKPYSKVIQIVLKLVLDKEIGIYDFFSTSVNFARLGLMKASEGGDVVIENNIKHGTIVGHLNLAEECPSWSIILKESEGQLYMDTTSTNASEARHPPVLRLEHGDKRVALQLTGVSYLTEVSYLIWGSYLTGVSYLTEVSYLTWGSYLSGVSYLTEVSIQTGLSYLTGMSYLTGGSYLTGVSYLIGLNYLLAI